MKRKITLHKTNEMTRGGDKLSVHGKRLVNAIYYLVQMNVNEGKSKLIEDLEYIPLEFPYLRKMMGLEKVESYIKEIENAFNELQEPMQLNNFRDPRTNELWQWYSISIISEASWKIDNNKKVAKVALSPLIKWLMINTHKGGNFTPLELIPTINKLRTKYAMKLYEYLKSFANYRYIDISQEHLMKLLGISKKSKYRYMSDMTILLNRQINELVKKTDLKELQLDNNPELKKDKKFRIIINPKAKKKTATKEEIIDILEVLTVKKF